MKTRAIQLLVDELSLRLADDLATVRQRLHTIIQKAIQSHDHESEVETAS